MENHDIQSVIDIGKALWDKFTPNHEQANVWYMALRQFSASEAISAMRDHAANSRFVPKPAEIADRCRAHQERCARSQNYRDLGAETDALHAEIEADRLETDTICNAMSAEEFEQHCRSAMAADWRLEWMGTANYWHTRMGRSIVALRVLANLGPDDVDPMCDVPDRLPPEKRAKHELFIRSNPVKAILRDWHRAGNAYNPDAANTLVPAHP